MPTPFRIEHLLGLRTPTVRMPFHLSPDGRLLVADESFGTCFVMVEDAHWPPQVWTASKQGNRHLWSLNPPHGGGDPGSEPLAAVHGDKTLA